MAAPSGPVPMRAALAGAAGGAAAAAAGTLLLLSRYLRRELRPASVAHSGDAEAEELLLALQPLLREYWPHPLFEFSGYASLALSGLWALLPAQHTGELEPLDLVDGGSVLLHWSSRPPAGPERVALVLPGLNNDSRTGFVQSTVRHLERQGYMSVVLNYRGIGGQELRTPRLGCGDSWRDIPEVLAHVQRRFPQASLFALGFSMGGGLLLRHLGVEGASSPLVGAVAISAPVDWLAVGASLEGTLKKRMVNFAMANGVKMLMLSALRHSPFVRGLDMRRVWLATRIRQIEEAIICPLHGYRDADDYYAQNSARPVLGNIAVPTLVLNSKDDPVVGIHTMPLDEMKSNPNIFSAFTRRGGHIGWGTGGLRGDDSWADSVASAFLGACAARAREGAPATRARL